MTGPRARAEEARLAVIFLTRLPAGRLADPAPGLSAARWAFPLVGVLTGLIGWAAFALATWAGLEPRIAALLSVMATALATGGLHLDGLADVADGFWGGHDRDRRLEIMRDSRIGSYGVIALILVLGLKVAGIAAAGGSLLAFVMIGIASRASMVILLDVLPPARGDGLGHTAGSGAGGPVAATVIAALCLFALINPAHYPAALGMAVAMAAVAALARAKIGGQTGDVLGACQALGSALAWVGLSALA